MRGKLRKTGGGVRSFFGGEHQVVSVAEITFSKYLEHVGSAISQHKSADVERGLYIRLNKLKHSYLY